MKTFALVIVAATLAGLAVWKLCFVTPPTTIPALANQWHEQVYSLDEDETLRFVPPPFDPQRMKDARVAWQKQIGLAFYGSDQLYIIYRGSRVAYPKFRLGNYLEREPPENPKTFGDLKAAMEYAANGYWPDAMVAEDLKGAVADGDWIVRHRTSLHRRMMALQSVLRSVTGRNLAIEYESVEREVDDEDNWSLLLDNHEPLRVIRDRHLQPAIILRERTTATTRANVR